MAFTYKGLSGTLSRRVITPDEVDRQIQRLLQQTPRFSVITDRPTQLGDEVILDYAGFCDGVQFPGGTADHQSLTLGSGMFIPGFEEQLIGKNIGEEVTVSVTFPEQYHSEDLAGKAAEFRCLIHEIRVSGSYEADDTFAKEVGGCDTFEELQQKLQQSMQNHADEQAEMELMDNLLRSAAATLEEDPTEAQIQTGIDELLSHLSARLAQQQLSLDSYCTFMSTTVEKLREELRPSAINHAKTQMAVDRIVELEKLVPTQEEMGNAIALVAQQNGLTVEQLRPYYDAELERAIVRSILASKVSELIRANATITEA